jgi:Peptidase_C39 like family/Phage tail lysozyme
VQWTPANTKVPGIVAAAKIQGDVYELATQLEMVWAQLDGKAGGYSETQAGDELKSTRTIEEAVRAFQGDSAVGGKYRGYERPADQQGSIGRRIKNAQSVKNLYGGQSTPPASDGAEASIAVDAPVSSGCASYSGPGENTKYYDGFTVYSQYDPAWANKAYSSSTISSSGCGPSAMAMIITTLTGKQVTPLQTSQYAASKNLYVPGQGSKWTIASELAPNWGLKATAIGANVAAVTTALQSGSLVITAGKGPTPFTRGGHFIVIRAVTADGKWRVGDSGHNDTSDKDWDPNQLIKSMSGGSVYAISK